ncbi:MAG: prepilin-type N-terminal cleavage/methylation domain-containing protein [Bryobacterales bacterium]|nr:prepilin-type N-terminal cleavage/methylation domain-containing protein [Bryobacteraceae bacterium]MDW8354436.1 prepilin-type N-terminal cleavage/methylation domain-containing protein [Bryobacterales bacterium]
MSHRTLLAIPACEGAARRLNSCAGVTLIEMLMVAALIALLAGLSLPRIATGVDFVRLAGAADSVASLFNAAWNRAERRGEVLEIGIVPGQGRIRVRSSGGFQKEYVLPEGVTVEAVLPRLLGDDNSPRHFVVFPGGTVPSIAVELANRRGARRIVRLDPITGAPRVERAEVR